MEPYYFGSILILISGFLGFLSGRSYERQLASLPDDFGEECPFDDETLHTNYNTGEKCRCGLSTEGHHNAFPES